MSVDVDMRAVVTAALTPVRAEPSVRAEQVSQELLGGVLRVLERRGDWSLVAGEDDYEGWVNTGSVTFRDEPGGEAWWDDLGGLPAIALDATLVDDDGEPVIRLPWGARVAMASGVIGLPDGRTARLGEGRLLSWLELSRSFPASGIAVAATARGWLGTPYVWGGRTRWGADCSGLVQAVYRTHGFLLPRDSHQQIEIGEPVEPGGGLEETLPGDLVYFRDRGSGRIAHVAMSLGGSRIIHSAEANGGVMVNDLGGEGELERALAARLAGVRRIHW